MAEFGNALSAGDVNGDGYDDLIVGAWGHSFGQANEGKVYVFLGGAAGLAIAPAWSRESNVAQLRIGASVSFAGDVNGDGYGDFLVGSDVNGPASAPKTVELFLGAPILPTTPAWSVTSGVPGFGSVVSGDCDVNADGYSDFLIGERGFSDGRALLFLGGPGGPSATPDWVANSDQADSGFARALDCATDITGDGYDDVLIGSPQFNNGQSYEGRAAAFKGSAALPDAVPFWASYGGLESAFFGTSLAGVGDSDGDGLGDVLVGSPLLNGGVASEGRGSIFFGSLSALAVSPDVVLDENLFHGNLGHSTHGGDFDGDGIAELVIAAPGAGLVFVFGLGVAPELLWSVSAPPEILLGYSEAISTGDFNADGFLDLAIGARYDAESFQREGAAHTFYGPLSGGAQNVPPVVFDQSIEVPANTYAEIFLIASDGNGTQVSFEIVDLPINGSINGTPPEITYTPNENFIGADVFRFVASDGGLSSEVGSVFVTVTGSSSSGGGGGGASLGGFELSCRVGSQPAGRMAWLGTMSFACGMAGCHFLRRRFRGRRGATPPSTTRAPRFR